MRQKYYIHRHVNTYCTLDLSRLCIFLRILSATLSTISPSFDCLIFSKTVVTSFSSFRDSIFKKLKLYIYIYRYNKSTMPENAEKYF